MKNIMSVASKALIIVGFSFILGVFVAPTVSAEEKRAAGPSQAPIITSQPFSNNATQGATFRYDVNAYDPDAADTITYGLSQAPAGMKINTKSGLITWTPKANQANTSQFVTVTVTDGIQTVSQSFSVYVSPAPVNFVKPEKPARISSQAPVIISEPFATTVTQGGKFQYDVNAYDPDAADTITYGLSQAPAGMKINTKSGLITWTPKVDYVNTAEFVTVTATDGLETTYQSFSVFVAPAPEAPTRVAAATTKSKTSSTKTSKSTPSTNSSRSLFGRSEPETLEIRNITVSSGPRNINNSVSSANCNVVVSWNTTVPSSGQVSYGEVSQQNIEKLNYPQSATEGAALSTNHQVALPTCFEEKTYFFRVIAFTTTDRVVSDEKTILPIPVETPVESTSVSSGPATASALGTLGTWIGPLALLIIVGAIVLIVVKKLRVGSKGSSSHHGGGGHEAEPVLEIPHH